MIIGDKREQVIENIRQAAENGMFDAKVEVNDPKLTAKQLEKLLDDYFEKRPSMWFCIDSWIARQITNSAVKIINKTTKIVGLENVGHITGGAILTSNHFSQIDNTILRAFTREMGKKKLYVVSQDTNLAMSGWVGFLLNYADTVPISFNRSYMSGRFAPMLKELLDGGNYVLIYPEQEMWFNYRKPRPLKRGAYYYAAELNVPVISCFVEMRDLDEMDRPNFHKVRYILHILPPIFSDPAKSIRENSIAMCEQDYRQKKSAYEAAYGKPMDYRFEPDDIAGWVPTDGTKKCFL